MQLHRWQPTRLPHPWDSPGKNTGVGCHFLLQCMKVKSESEVTQSYPTLSDPMDYSLTGSSVHGIFQARVLEWGAIAFSRCQARAPQIPSPWSSRTSLSMKRILKKYTLLKLYSKKCSHHMVYFFYFQNLILRKQSGIRTKIYVPECLSWSFYSVEKNKLNVQQQ